MSSINRSDSQHTIHAILTRKYRSMILFIGVLLIGLWLSLSAYVLNNLYREAMDRMYSWVLINKSRLEEAQFLKNYDSVGFRFSQWASLHDGFSVCEMSLYDPDRKLVVGTLPFPTESEGLGYSVPHLGIHYFDSLFFAGNRVGYLYLKSRFRPLLFIAVLVFLFAVCMGMFLAVRRILTSFMRTLELRIVAPIEALRDSMNRFDMDKDQSFLRLSQESRPATEVAELYDGYNSLITRIREYSELEVKKAEADAEFRIAAQVAHDIRSPLAALRTAASALANVPEDSRNLIRLAVDRIHDIANNLIESTRTGGSSAEKKIGESKAAGDSTQTESVLILIDEIVTEKRAEFSGEHDAEIQFTANDQNYPLFSMVNAREFKRLMSNLINNAVEATPSGKEGRIQVRLTPKAGQSEILLVDNGKGIPPEILPQLTRRGFSYDKPHGTGLGLHHARATVEGWGGSLCLESQPGQGTTVRILLPPASAPHWFLPRIDASSGSHFVVVDDDPSIHQLWRTRFRSAEGTEEKVKLSHLYTPSEFRDWVKSNPVGETRFLVDFEYTGHPSNGLELIEELKVGRYATLVTGRYADSKVRAECNRLDVRLLPKMLAPFVPIHIR